MNSLLKRIAGDQTLAGGDAPPSFPQTVANSVHSLFQRITGPAMPPRNEAVVETSRQPSGTSAEDGVTAGSPLQQPDSSGSSSPVNDEPHSALWHRPEPPDSIGISRSATTPRRKQDARRNSLDPLQRYFSPHSHSLPDYGQLRPTGTMGRYLKHVNASFAPGPVNTMSSSKTQTVPVSSRNATDRLPAKRQRTDHSGRYTTSVFMPVNDGHEIPRDQRSRTERHGSQSIISVEDKLRFAEVQEYRAVEQMHDPNKRYRTNNRSRPNRGRLMYLDVNETDPIQESSDESFSDLRSPGHPSLATAETRGSNQGKVRSLSDPAELAILGAGKKRFKSPANQDYTHTLKRKKKVGDMTGEPDELGYDPDYNSGQPIKKLNAGHERRQPAESSSISTRGDLKPSLAAAPKSDPSTGEGMPLKKALWAPNHVFEASESLTDEGNQELFVLVSKKADHATAVLSLLPATSPPGDPPKYGWLCIWSKKMEKVKVSYDQGIVKIVMPMDLDRNLGRTLYLQFYGKEETQAFAKWARQHSNVNLEPDPAGALEREFATQYAKVKNRPEAREHHLATTPANAEAGQRTVRRGLTLTEARIPQSGRRLIDRLDYLSEGKSVAHSYHGSDGDSAVESRPRRRLRSHLDLSSPELMPIPDRWTDVNPDWDKDWRLPLAFHRTMIDKDDIPRLDEGQCLNDNVIGFYLKYLQLQAEKQRPEIEKKVYFHNSFFYTKLKPTSGRHINYDGVKNWTAKVDLFSYDYIVVPVNEHFHWWVAIICNPGKLDSTLAQDAPGSHDSGDEVEEVLAVSLSGSNTGSHPSPRDDSDVAAQQGRDVMVIDDQAKSTRLDEIYRLQDDSADDVDEKVVVPGKDRDSALTLDDDDDGPTPGKKAPRRGRKAGRKSIGAPRRYNPGDPRIITLDSLGASHSPVCTHLKQYLIAEFKDKKGKDIEYKQAIGTRATNLPEQNNFCDCGVYLLKYVAEFLSDPDKFIQSILLREGKEWDFNASEMRNEIRQLIFDLHAPYQEEQEKNKRLKALAKRKRERSKSDAPADCPASSPPELLAEPAASSQRDHEPVDPAPTPSHGPSPIADTATSPPATAVRSTALRQAELSKTPPEAQERTSRGSSQYDTRTFHLVDDGDSKQTADAAPSPQSVQSSASHSQLMPSIEIADDDELPAAPRQRLGSSRHSSLGFQRPSIEGSDDKVVEIPRAGFSSPPQRRRKRSGSQTEMSAASFYRKTPEQPLAGGKGKQPAKQVSASLALPRYPSPEHVLQPNSEESPFFGPGWRRTTPAKVKTYKGAHKTPNGGQTIDLTDD